MRNGFHVASGTLLRTATALPGTGGLPTAAGGQGSCSSGRSSACALPSGTFGWLGTSVGGRGQTFLGPRSQRAHTCTCEVSAHLADSLAPGPDSGSHPGPRPRAGDTASESPGSTMRCRRPGLSPGQAAPSQVVLGLELCPTGSDGTLGRVPKPPRTGLASGRHVQPGALRPRPVCVCSQPSEAVAQSRLLSPTQCLPVPSLLRPFSSRVECEGGS